MYNSWGKQVERLPEVVTTIWTCENDDCNGWMRDSLTFDDVPTCALCNSTMNKSEKLLPVLMTSEEEMKRFKKKQAASKAT